MNRVKISTILTAIFGLIWLVCLADWLWFGQFAKYHVGISSGGQGIDFPVIYVLVFSIATLVSLGWLIWAWFQHPRVRWLIVVGSLCYPCLWQSSVFLTDLLVELAKIDGLAELKVHLARLGLAGLFLLGLGWTIWLLETRSKIYEAARVKRALEDDEGTVQAGVAVLPATAHRPIWNPLDLNAWFYHLQAGDLVRFWRWPGLPRKLAALNVDVQTRPKRKLNQSLSGLAGYTVAFLVMFLVLSNIGGCEEAYEMPAGGGEQKQLAQVVKVQKVIKKKFVVNPFSVINFRVPPIEEIQLQLMEVTKHHYKVGQGAGEGAGFASGTKSGKVRFIRLEYTGGDWDQDFGIGADLNMLIEYGLRTTHRVAEKTESRPVSSLKNFAKLKSPPFVFMTGQKNISLSKSEVRTLHNYLTDQHGMLFIDNGGSSHFHNQVISMMNQVLPGVRPVEIPRDDVIHRIPYQIPRLPYVAPHGGKAALGWKVDGRWLAYYHPGDIGDAWTDDHSGVSPEIYEACYQLGTNVIFYAHAEYSKWVEAQKDN